VTLARAGKKVIVVPTDLRSNALQCILELSTQSDGADIPLNGGARNAVHPAGIKNLSIASILLSESMDGEPLEFLVSERISAVMPRLRKSADFILVESAPLLQFADATFLAPACDAAFVVADTRHDLRSDVREGREQLERMHITVLGAALINARGGADRLRETRASIGVTMRRPPARATGRPNPVGLNFEPVSHRAELGRPITRC
jgi:Mrp family chromosome partitioning ATPase